MKIFYVSCRPIRIEEKLLTPRDHISGGFVGLDIIGQVLAEDRHIDGRMVYEIIIGKDSQYTDQQCSDYQAIVLEGLAAFGVHLKTIESAQMLIEQICGVEFPIVEGRIVPPAPDRIV